MSTLTTMNHLPHPNSWKSGSSFLKTIALKSISVMGKALKEAGMRKAIRELSMLDDRALRDMGLTRETIEQAVRYGK